MMAAGETDLCRLETSAAEERLLAAYKRCDEMEKKLEDSKAAFEEILAKNEITYKTAAAAKEHVFKSELDAKMNELQMKEQIIEKEKANGKVMLGLIEELADEEQKELRAGHERSMEKQKEEVVALHDKIWKLEHQKTRLEQQLEDGHSQQERLMTEMDELRRVSAGLARDKSGLLAVIERKEQQMFNTQACCVDATTRNNELKRESFIQNHMLELFKEKLQPKDMQIREMQKIIKQLTVEIRKMKNRNLILSDDLLKASQRIQLFKDSLAKSQQKTHDAIVREEKLAVGVVAAVKAIGQPVQLQAAVQEIYDIHLKSCQHRVDLSMENDCIDQMKRQRTIYEHTFDNLRKKISALNMENARMKQELRRKEAKIQCPPSPLPEP